MPIFDIFSRRQRKLRGELPDVYTYNDLPQPLRVQIVHIWMDSLGNREEYYGNMSVSKSYELTVNALRREYGVFLLPGTSENHGNYFAELADFLLQEKDVKKALDAVEISFRVVDRLTRDWDYLKRNNASKIADDAIEELNARFKEHGVGYQFTNGQIVRIDSEFLHAEIVKPALKLLDQPHYAGAQQEFLKAHEHYRKGNAKEALSECLKAFESVMKAICDKRGWTYGNNATAKPLIQACFDNGLIPSFWQSHYSSLRNLLESSVPTGRNKLSGHGQGTTPVSVPNHLVAYMLHMTASAIVFLVEADEKAP
ncbi:MAG: hypothetical protein OXH63_14070 [Gemmatimonadetes bacterium]|nr:hypothetical protein [Gemmatimonadota bacterium]